MDASCGYLTPARGHLPRDWPQVTLTKPSTDERLDAALALDAAHAVGPDQRLLRVLLADDQSTFERALDERPAQHRAGAGAGAGENPAPGTLLPLGAITLVALAVQVHGWDLQTRSAYLPTSLLKPPAPVGSAPDPARRSDGSSPGRRATAGPLPRRRTRTRVPLRRRRSNARVAERKMSNSASSAPHTSSGRSPHATQPNPWPPPRTTKRLRSTHQ
ncbi:Imm49 family immunity protein [Streptomyces sp. NPDC048383]|uniref:Imm49 family immunity protein n=1 Tax=Streptomyces sp. NPDC048383 TaxID=3155386 RepID=UPI0034439513